MAQEVKPNLHRVISAECIVEIFYVERMRHYLLTVNDRTVLRNASFEVLERYADAEWPEQSSEESAA